MTETRIVLLVLLALALTAVAAEEYMAAEYGEMVQGEIDATFPKE